MASPGIVKGVVKVCESVSDIDKVQTGEILVASMTRPEYLPAMQKAAAFITDEGGITCHAAIIAREMKKPCIIGTKKATKVLKDGDLVEVDSNKGIVRKLK
jgi:pyruvate,water dikinase